MIPLPKHVSRCQPKCDSARMFVEFEASLSVASVVGLRSTLLWMYLRGAFHRFSVKVHQHRNDPHQVMTPPTLCHTRPVNVAAVGAVCLRNVCNARGAPIKYRHALRYLPIPSQHLIPLFHQQAPLGNNCSAQWYLLFGVRGQHGVLLLKLNSLSDDLSVALVQPTSNTGVCPTQGRLRVLSLRSG